MARWSGAQDPAHDLESGTDGGNGFGADVFPLVSAVTDDWRIRDLGLRAGAGRASGAWLAVGSGEGAGPRVFLVEDDARLRGLVRELFEDEGCTVVGEAASAGEVSVLVPLAAVRPLVVLMDVQISGDVDGIEATRRLLTNGLAVRVVMFTGMDDEATRRAARAAGAVGFVEKGVACEVLIATVRDAWRGLADVV
jgi:CheY-like chemotaxis protein